jgi:hypothetical protein
MDINLRLIVVLVAGAEESMTKDAEAGFITYRGILGLAPPSVRQHGTT